MEYNQMWFGTRGHMQWVPCPSVNVGASKQGWSSQMNYLSGGASTRSSRTAHKEYDLSWNLTTAENIRTITDFADGVFGFGPIYWGDPFTMDKNMLPQYWATPSLAAADGPILDSGRIRPTLVPTSSNIYGYPADSAVFNVKALAPSADRAEVFIPIPPDHTAWVGAHGELGGAASVQVTVATGKATTGATASLTMLPVTTSTRFNHSVTSAEGIGIIIRLGGVGQITLAGLMVQVLPTGTAPEPGGFISGQGHSGCSFNPQPSVTQYSAALDLVGLTARLVETEAWRIVPNN